MTDHERKIKILEYANDVRKFEIGLFWQRSLFFWGFTTTAVAAYGAAYQTHRNDLKFAVACAGLVCGVIWTLVNRSGKYWQKAWELKLDQAQEDAIKIDLFSSKSNQRLDIQESWYWGPKHFSVSKLAIAFSDFTVLVWVGLILKSSPVWPLLLKCPLVANSLFVPVCTFVCAIAYLAVVFVLARPDESK